MSDFQRFHIGETIPGWPVRSWDQVGDVVDAFQSRGPALPGEPPLVTPVNRPKIVNKHTSDLTKPFGILKIDEPLNTPTANADEPYQGVRLTGKAPDTDTESDLKFAVLQAACQQDQAVDAVMLGPTWVKVDVQDESDTTAAPVDTDTDKLKSGSGVPILWKETGTGVKWAVVLLGGGGAKVSIERVAITGVASGTTWDPATDSLVPGEVFAHPLIWNTANSRYELGVSKRISTSLTATFNITTGWYLLGIAIDDELVNVDCQEVPGSTISL